MKVETAKPQVWTPLSKGRPVRSVRKAREALD